jgi:hypothetical protein
MARALHEYNMKRKKPRGDAPNKGSVSSFVRRLLHSIVDFL